LAGINSRLHADHAYSRQRSVAAIPHVGRIQQICLNNRQVRPAIPATSGRLVRSAAAAGENLLADRLTS